MSMWHFRAYPGLRLIKQSFLPAVLPSRRGSGTSRARRIDQMHSDRAGKVSRLYPMVGAPHASTARNVVPTFVKLLAVEYAGTQAVPLKGVGPANSPSQYRHAVTS